MEDLSYDMKALYNRNNRILLKNADQNAEWKFFNYGILDAWKYVSGNALEEWHFIDCEEETQNQLYEFYKKWLLRFFKSVASYQLKAHAYIYVLEQGFDFTDEMPESCNDYLLDI